MKTLAIIGGGIHGCMLFINLPPKLQKNTIVIDVHEKPLKRFVWQCRAIGVSHLRSPCSHSIHRDFRHLLRYARTNGFGESHFSGPYFTPSFSLFTEHAHTLLKQSAIQERWIQGRVTGLSYFDNQWTIRYTQQSKISTQIHKSLDARRVILALGQDDARIPTYLTGDLEPHNHVLHKSFVQPKPQSNVCIIGGGMSGTQCAMRLAKTRQYNVTLISGHPHTVTHFDGNPCFIGPRCLPSFLSLKSYQERAAMLKQHRYPGSINPAVYKELAETQNNTILAKHFSIIQERVVSVRKHGGRDQKYDVHLSNNICHFYDTVICATGLNTPATTLKHHGGDLTSIPTETEGTLIKDDKKNLQNKSYTNVPKSVAPHQEIIEPLIHDYQLPHAAGNFPIVSPNLEWHTNLFVSGALAELEIGIAARNIIGAHLAYRRLKNIWHTWE